MHNTDIAEVNRGARVFGLKRTNELGHTIVSYNRFSRNQKFGYIGNSGTVKKTSVLRLKRLGFGASDRAELSVFLG